MENLINTMLQDFIKFDDFSCLKDDWNLQDGLESADEITIDSCELHGDIVLVGLSYIEDDINYDGNVQVSMLELMAFIYSKQGNNEEK